MYYIKQGSSVSWKTHDFGEVRIRKNAIFGLEEQNEAKNRPPCSFPPIRSNRSASFCSVPRGSRSALKVYTQGTL